MKSSLARLVAVLLAAASVHGETGLQAFAYLRTFPLVSLERMGPSPSAADYFGRWEKLPPFATVGFGMDAAGFRLRMEAELQQNLSIHFAKSAWNNFPIKGDSPVPFLSTFYPRVGFAEYRDEALFVSAGRRKLARGPGTYDLALSADPPFHDHASGELTARFGSAKFAYGFTVVMPRHDSIGYSDGTARPRTFFEHRLRWEAERLRIALSEQNLIDGRGPDLQDAGPFVVYHHSFAANSNVITTLSAEAEPVDSLRIYGEGSLDDVMLPDEVDSNPTALGWLLGLEWAVAPGRPPKRAPFFNADWTAREPTFAAKGGLRLAYEWYRTSAYLYNRSTAKNGAERYTTRYRLEPPPVAGYPELFEAYIGFPYGPDTDLHLLSIRWDEPSFSASASLGLRRTGALNQVPTFDVQALSDWLGPTPPVRGSLDAQASLVWVYSPDVLFMLRCGGSFGQDWSSWQVDLGAAFRLAWPRDPDSEVEF
jgi:hypothetical protein